MSLYKEILQTQEGFDFPFTSEQVQKLRNRTDKLEEESREAFSRAMMSDGLIRDLNNRMSAELSIAENLYLTLAKKLEEGKAVVIRPLEETEDQFRNRVGADLRSVLEPNPVSKKMAESPYFPDFFIHTEEVEFPRVKGRVIEDLINSTFERPDLPDETTLVSVEQAFRAGLMVNLNPQPSSVVKTK